MRILSTNFEASQKSVLSKKYSWPVMIWPLKNAFCFLCTNVFTVPCGPKLVSHYQICKCNWSEFLSLFYRWGTKTTWHLRGSWSQALVLTPAWPSMVFLFEAHVLKIVDTQNSIFFLLWSNAFNKYERAALLVFVFTVVHCCLLPNLLIFFLSCTKPKKIFISLLKYIPNTCGLES